MPVLLTTTTASLQSPPTNAFGLVQYLQQRLPGYDPSEYLRELNSAYIHVWEEVTKLKNNYFTNTVVVTVTKSQFQYDLQFNADAALSAAVSPRLYQLTKVRVQPPSAGLFLQTKAMNPNEPDFVSLNANPTSAPAQNGPYFWYLSGRNQINFALPLGVGSKIECTFTFWPIALTMLNAGTVSSSTVNVTGSGTGFTGMVQPDFRSSLPSVQGQEEIQAELVCNTNQIYRVTTITSDTALTTFTAINPALPASSAYVLATLPEIPREHIRVIASGALRSMYSVAGDDQRVAEWTAIAASNMQMCKDSLIERQGQDPPTKKRFPFGIGRTKSRSFLR